MQPDFDPHAYIENYAQEHGWQCCINKKQGSHSNNLRVIVKISNLAKDQNSDPQDITIVVMDHLCAIANESQRNYNFKCKYLTSTMLTGNRFANSFRDYVLSSFFSIAFWQYYYSMQLLILITVEREVENLNVVYVGA